MNSLFSTIWLNASSLLGATVFLGLMWWIAKAHSQLWLRASQAYSGHMPTPPNPCKGLDRIVISGRATRPRLSAKAGYRAYPVGIAIHDSGIAVSAISPFNVMCPPIRLPFDEMEVSPTWWGQWREPVAVRMKQAPDVDIILARDTVRWLREHTKAFGRKPD